MTCLKKCYPMIRDEPGLCRPLYIGASPSPIIAATEGSSSVAESLVVSVLEGGLGCLVLSAG